jgi:hypothetical protein
VLAVLDGDRSEALGDGEVSAPDRGDDPDAARDRELGSDGARALASPLTSPLTSPSLTPWSWIRSARVFSCSPVVIIASRICLAASDASFRVIAVIRERSASVTSGLAIALSTRRAPDSDSRSMPPMLGRKLDAGGALDEFHGDLGVLANQVQGSLMGH